MWTGDEVKKKQNKIRKIYQYDCDCATGQIGVTFVSKHVVFEHCENAIT